MRIQVEHVSKAFGTFHALRDVSLDVASGELVALLGPSGSGKTTLLRMIAGLDAPDGGRVQFDGEDTTDRDLRDRHVGFVFQHYALFRHMSVFENIAFGLRVRPRRERPPQAVIRDRVLKLLKLVHLDGLADRFPSQLSGGQRQRVALARALAVEPRVLLLDEPFGALDARVRRDLRRWLRRLHDDLGITSVFVTHDQEEALELADRVVIMRQGQIEQVGDPSQVYQQPASAFVYDFLGDVNRLPGVVRDRQLELGARSIRLDDARVTDGDVDVLVRPHLLELAPPASPDSLWTAKVHYVNLAGPVVRIELLMPWGGVARSEMAHERFRSCPILPGELVGMRARRDDMFFDQAPASASRASAATEGALA